MKWLVGLAATLAVVLAASAAASADVQVNPDPQTYHRLDVVDDPAGAVRTAREFVAKGDLPGAIASLARYVGVHPREVYPRRFLGDLYYRNGQLDKAEAVYNQLIAENDHDRETHNRLGTVYAAENQVDAAIAQYTAALPGTDSVTDLVALHVRKGDIARYRIEMETLATGAPQNSELQAELGQVYGALHMTPEALRQFKLAADLDPESLAALNGAGLAYLDMHAFALARQEFLSCLRYEPASFSCMNNLGATDLEAGNYADADRELQHAHAIAPERAEALVNFGYLSDARGDWKGAIAQYAKAIAVGPYTSEAYVDMGLAYEVHNLYPLAQAVLIKGIAANPADGRLHVLLARAYESQGQHARAVAEYRIAANSLDKDAARIAQAALGGARQPQR